MMSSTERSREFRKRTARSNFVRKESRIVNKPDAIAELKAAVIRINRKYTK